MAMVAVLYAVGSAGIAGVAGTFRSPLSPPLPHGATASDAVRTWATVLGINRLPGDVRAIVALFALAIVGAGWLIALREEAA